MSKNKTILRNALLSQWRNYYYSEYLNLYGFKFLPLEVEEYILKQFWHNGTISGFIVEGTKPSEFIESVNDYPNGMIAFTPYAPFLYNIYDYPIQVNLIQTRGAKFIPTRAMVVDKDVVIGYAQKSKKPVEAIVNYYIEKIVDVELTMRSQLKAMKTPWLISCDSENESKLKRLFEKINNDEVVLYVSADEVQALSVLNTNTPYHLTNLYGLYKSYHDELKTFLGINNTGTTEKKEHLITSEVNANNEIIAKNKDNFFESLKAFDEKCATILGYPLGVYCKKEDPCTAEDKTEEDTKGDDEDENLL